MVVRFSSGSSAPGRDYTRTSGAGVQLIRTRRRRELGEARQGARNPVGGASCQSRGRKVGLNNYSPLSCCAGALLTQYQVEPTSKRALRVCSHVLVDLTSLFCGELFTEVKMSLPLSLLLSISMALLCFGEQHVEEIIKANQAPRSGGWSEVSPDSKDVQEAALYALKMFNSNSKGKKLFKIQSINTAYSQVTNMVNFKIDTILSKTKCSKAENHDLDRCEVLKKHLGCQFAVTFNNRNKKHVLKSRSCKKLGKEEV